MSEEGVQGTEPENDPKFRVLRAALETGRVAALNEGIKDETEILVIVQVSGEDGASLSLLDPQAHLDMLVRATQSFADLTDQPIQVMRVTGKGQG